MDPSVELKTVLTYFYHWEKQKPQEVFLRQPFGDSFKDYTWQEVGNQARRIATYLQSLGLPPKSNIGLISKNCAHWFINDLAILMAGHVSVPFYPTLSAEALGQVMTHSGCKVLFVGKIDNGVNFYAGIPQGVTCIAYPAEYENSPVNRQGYLQWNDLLAAHAPLEGEVSPALDDLMSIRLAAC
ncbi:MAG: AMP-binding protein [Spirosomataceae bacterium]